MIRKAFVMSVHQGSEAEYERRHNPIWPDLERMLKAHGVRNYSISLHPATHQLFGYVEVEDETLWLAIANTPECKRWWHYMTDIMPHNSDDSPLTSELVEVFYLA
jgi:L-rhamnose mutarotase